MRVRGREYRAVWMEGRELVAVNQPLLPHRFELARLRDHRATARAIRTMVVRGAGTIGATAAYGLAQACLEAARARGRRRSSPAERRRSFLDRVRAARAELSATRPTAADLDHALERVAARLEPALAEGGVEAACAAAVAEAEAIADEYVERGRRIGEAGLPLVPDGARVLTHCNAGWLALVDWGSAPAPVYRARREGREVFVWVDETRPRNQGANLTSWELLQEGVPHRIVADNAGGYLMRRGEVDLCIVGADRIAANGDVANKIGTYEKAVLAREHGIPFYVAAPSSTIDWRCATGDAIPIEQRDEAELHYVVGRTAGNSVERVRVSPRGAAALNPAFDLTPARYVTGILTERGLVPPGDLGRLRERTGG